MDRDTILEAAAHIFSQKGFHAASMQDIAEAVSLQKASLYHHVSSKQEILLALLDQALDILIDRISAVLELPIPPEQKLRKAMETYMGVLTEHGDLASILLLEHRSLNSQLQSLHYPRRNRFEALWRLLIEEGLDSGAFCCVEPGLAARALLGVMNWTITWFRHDGKLTSAEIAEEYADFFLSGLLVRNGR